MTTFIGEIGLVSILFILACSVAMTIFLGTVAGIWFHFRRLQYAADQYREAASIYRQAQKQNEKNQVELEFLRKQAQEVTEMQSGGVETLLKEYDDLKAQTAWFDRITDRQPNWEYQ